VCRSRPGQIRHYLTRALVSGTGLEPAKTEVKAQVLDTLHSPIWRPRRGSNSYLLIDNQRCSPLHYETLEEGGRIERRALITPPRFSGPLGHHCPAPSEIRSPCPDSNRLHPLTKRTLFLLSYKGTGDGANRTRSVALLQSAAFPFGYVVMVRALGFEPSIAGVRVRRNSTFASRAWLRDVDSNDDDEAQNLAACRWLISDRMVPAAGLKPAPFGLKIRGSVTRAPPALVGSGSSNRTSVASAKGSRPATGRSRNDGLPGRIRTAGARLRKAALFR